MMGSLRSVGLPIRLEVLMKQQYLRIISNISTIVQNEFTTSQTKKKSAVHKQLYSKILTCGPISVADYMKEALTNPIDGYYIKNSILGKEGDFITSPEISQLFGEMIAVWILHELSVITNKSFQLIELGPGRGTLLSDVLRIFKRFQVNKKVSLHLVEISPALSAIQAEILCDSSKDISPDTKRNNSIRHYKEGVTEDGVQVFWYHSFNDIPSGFSIIIAHEFFDALPIHKFQKTDKGWREVLVDIDPNSLNHDKFRFVLSRSPTLASTMYLQSNETRNHVEVNPLAMVIIDNISTYLTRNGGFCLIIDYGHNGEKTDTLRSFRGHEQHDPLLKPGSADITADVDFSMIKRIANQNNRLITFGPVNQGDFLRQLGIDVRLESLLKNAQEHQKDLIQSGYRKIVDDNEMGSVFKVMSLFPAVLRDHLKNWPVVGFRI